jgi:hydrogenase nickel incorporation protein HypA/HybF
MHELSIALSIIELVQEESDSRGGIQVDAIHLKVGQLSGIAKEALVSAYDLASQQTPLQGTRLVIEDIPVLVNCPQCQTRRQVQSLQFFCCVVCGTPGLDVAQGRELTLAALEVRS